MKNLRLHLTALLSISLFNIHSMEFPQRKAPSIYYAPWRDKYQIEATKAHNQPTTECPFCKQIAEKNDEKYFILYRSTHCFVMLSCNPYTKMGQMLINPYHHTPTMEELTKEELFDKFKVFIMCIKVLENVVQPNGFDCGGQFGEHSGATVPQHIHFQVIPKLTFNLEHFTEEIHNSDGSINLHPIYERLKAEFERLSTNYS